MHNDISSNDILRADHGDNHHHHHLWESGSTWLSKIGNCGKVLDLVEVHAFLSPQPVDADGVDKQAGLLAVGSPPLLAGCPPSSLKTSRQFPPS